MEIIKNFINNLLGKTPGKESISIQVPIFHSKLPIPEKVQQLNRERNIIRLEAKMKEAVLEMMRVGCLAMIPDWLDLSNRPIRREMERKVNGWLYENLYKKKYIYSYRTMCNISNNPPEIYKADKLALTVWLNWERTSKERRYDFLVSKDEINAKDLHSK